MTFEELSAWEALKSGNLEPFAEVLKCGEHTLHPVLGGCLLTLMRGTVDETDFRLKLVRHPDLQHPAQGRHAQRELEGLESDTAMLMAQHGALEPGGFEAAVTATRLETRKSRATIAAHWAKHKAFIKQAVELGQSLVLETCPLSAEDQIDDA